MKSDARLHPHLFIVDSAGASHPLLGEKLATNPRFSPDGKKVACSAFESSSRPWILTIIDVATGKAISPRIGSLSAKFKWSPDSRWVAVEGTALDTSLRTFSVVEAASGRVVLQDTTDVVANYEFAWSPDSRMVAVARPTEIDDHEELVRSELWLFGLSKEKCHLSVAANDVVSAPAWIDNHLIRIEQGGSAPSAAASPTVLEISCAKSP
jgi:tricorn protease-like protein